MKSQQPISPYQTQFEEQGFCHVDGLFAESELNEIEAFFEAYKRSGGAVFDAGSTYEEIDPGKRQVRAMHQDNFFLLSKPANCIAAWTPIDDSTEENGCLWVVPGSHRHDIYCPETDKKGSWNNYGDSHINPFPLSCLPCQKPSA